MNDIVDECRTEWKRLGVPTPIADEMAAELAADLAEAEAEGTPAEDVLGAATSDPRRFANAWAVERGVVGPRSGRRARRLPVLAAIAAFAGVAIAGAALVVASSPSESRRLAATSPDGRVIVLPAPRHGVAFPTQVPAPAPGPIMVRPDTDDDSGFDARIPGVVLLILGLTGVVTLTSFGLLRASRPAVA